MSDEKLTEEKKLKNFIDSVWAEEPGVQVRTSDQGGTVLIEFIRMDGSPGEPPILASATVAKYRWPRLTPKDCK